MHNLHLITLVLAALSASANGNPINNLLGFSSEIRVPPNMPETLISTPATRVQPVAPGPTYTASPGASFSISGAASDPKCEIELSKVGQCASGTVIMSKNTTCTEMKDHIAQPLMDCTTDTGLLLTAQVNLSYSKAENKIGFWYEEGFIGLTQEPKSFVPVAKEPQALSEGRVCICSTPLAMNTECSKVECREKTM